MPKNVLINAINGTANYLNTYIRKLFSEQKISIFFFYFRLDDHYICISLNEA